MPHSATLEKTSTNKTGLFLVGFLILAMILFFLFQGVSFKFTQNVTTAMEEAEVFSLDKHGLSLKLTNEAATDWLNNGNGDCDCLSPGRLFKQGFETIVLKKARNGDLAKNSFYLVHKSLKLFIRIDMEGMHGHLPMAGGQNNNYINWDTGKPTNVHDELGANKPLCPEWEAVIKKLAAMKKVAYYKP